MPVLNHLFLGLAPRMKTASVVCVVHSPLLYMTVLGSLGLVCNRFLFPETVILTKAFATASKD